MDKNITLESAIVKWLKDKEPHIHLKTYHRYHLAIYKQIIPNIGEMYLSDLTKDDIQQFFDSFNLAQKTLQTHKNVLLMCLRDYDIEEIVKKVSLNNHRQPKKIVPFTESEVEKLLQNSKDNLHDMILLAYRTGMRRGEIFGLQYTDISKTYLSVRQSVTSINSKLFYIKETKTKSSKRRIELDNACIEMLKKRAKNSKSDFVFGDENGYENPYSLPQKFQRLCRKSQVKPRRFHDLRHTHASILLSKNVHPKVVQERLGHSSVYHTIDIYSHCIPTLQEIAVDVFNNIEYNKKEIKL